MKRLSLVALCALAAPAAYAADVVLVSDGVANCRVVVSDGASHAEKFAARELQTYLSRATGCGALNGPLPVAIRVEAEPGIEPDGFVVDARPDGVNIVGANPRGALYGCYYILRNYAGMRWLVPGDDGEYCVLKGASVVLPARRTVVNPYSRVRAVATSYGSAALWEARNGFVPPALAGWYVDRKNPGAISARGVAAEEVGSAPSGGGGHMMSALMFGKDWGTGKPERMACAKRYFKEHPEWFPLIKGARHLGTASNESSPNPCLSNPALLDHMASNLLELIKGPYGAVGYVTIGNNDTTDWCECEKCRALDAPEAVTQGERADRYWWVVNELARRVWKVRPDAHLGGWAYQNFWFPPCRVKPDKRLSVCISFNCQCWRHAIDDPDCSVNRALREIYAAWKKLDMPLVYNRDEIACTGSPGSDYLPSERVVVKNILCQRNLGCAGSSYFLIRPPMEPEFCPWERKMWPFYGKNLRWSAMWQSLYLAGVFQWSPDADYEAVWEEANALYYGKGWEGGFRDFKKLQTKLFLEAPGCIGLGMPEKSPLARCLDVLGSEEKLRAFLEKALVAAAADPDPRALRHVARDKEIFEKTWLDAVKERRAELGSFDAYAAEGEPKVDGILDEHDWRVADVRPFFGATRANLRVAWRDEELFVAAEWAKGPLVLDFELPDGTDRVLRLAATEDGETRASKQAGAVKAKVRTEGGVRTLEAVVPLGGYGWKCRHGGNWKVRVDGPKPAGGFVQMRLIPKRQGVFKVEETYAYWRNATFDEGFPTQKIAAAQQWVHWTNETARATDVPKPWGGPNAWGATKSHDAAGVDRYVTLLPAKGAFFSQGYVAPVGGRMRLTFRARGKGKLSTWTASYVYDKANKPLRPETIVSTAFDLTDEWKTYSAEFTKLGVKDERVLIRLTPVGAPADVDDVYVNPM